MVNKDFLEVARELELHHHAVLAAYLLAARQGDILLVDVHLAYEVDIGGHGNSKLGTLYPPRAVGHNIEVSAKACVLNIGRRERYLVALVAVFVDAVQYAVMVELDGSIASDGADEIVLEHDNLVLIYVDVLEIVLELTLQKLASRQHVEQTLCMMAVYDALVLVVALAIELGGRLLLN